MTPDEWKQGMANEAESAGDVKWARELHQHAQRRSGGFLFMVLVAASAMSAALTLGSQWSVLTREAARNNATPLDLLWWGIAGNSQPLTIVGRGADPDLPVGTLLIFLFVLSALARRLRLPASLVLAAAALGVLIMSGLTSLLASGTAGFPGSTLLTAFGCAALGLVVGQAVQRRSAT